MLKHIFAIVLFSILCILFTPWVQQGLTEIISIHDLINESLKQVFSMGEVGSIIRQLIALLAVPALIAIIPAVVYRLTRHTWFPWTLELIWVIWLIETTAVVLYATPQVAAA